MNFLPERNREHIRQDIQADKVDVAVITLAPDDKPPGCLSLGAVPAGVYGARSIRSPLSARAVSELPFLMPAAGTQLTNSMLEELKKNGVVPRSISFYPYHDVRIRLVCRRRGVTFTLQSIVERHDPRDQLKLVFATQPWVRRLYISPRLEPASATAIASFLTRVLALPPPHARSTHHESVMGE
jgi:hypothetical protein